MSIALTCIHCKTKSRAPDGSEGKRVRCNKCGQTMVVPGSIIKLIDIPVEPLPTQPKTLPKKYWFPTDDHIVGSIAVLVSILLFVVIFVSGNSEPESEPESELAEKAEIRLEKYPEFERKTKPIYDQLLRIKSNLDIGINYTEFGKSVRELNFTHQKWADSLDNFEKSNPSVHLLRNATAAYKKSFNLWSHINEGTRTAVINKINIEDVHPYSVTMRHWEWKSASFMIELAKKCMKLKGVVKPIKCPFCSGVGQIKCPHCHGTEVCPKCQGNPNVKGSDGLPDDRFIGCLTSTECHEGTCHCVAINEQTIICPVCVGTGEFPVTSANILRDLKKIQKKQQIEMERMRKKKR